jgi:hypothetical protein
MMMMEDESESGRGAVPSSLSCQVWYAIVFVEFGALERNKKGSLPNLVA